MDLFALHLTCSLYSRTKPPFSLSNGTVSSETQHYARNGAVEGKGKGLDLDLHRLAFPDEPNVLVFDLGFDLHRMVLDDARPMGDAVPGTSTA